jgi:hypothetical protein
LNGNNQKIAVSNCETIKSSSAENQEKDQKDITEEGVETFLHNEEKGIEQHTE